LLYVVIPSVIAAMTGGVGECVAVPDEVTA
jgi:hypothetical protein